MIINKKTFGLFSFIFFLLISLIAITAYTISARQINHSFIEKQLSIASETIQLRLASAVNRELALVRKLADTPVIRHYFMNPSDPELEALARIEFDTYLEHFDLKIVFWVNDVDKIFYSTGNEPYVVDPDDPVSYWYNLTLYRTERYNFNINYNPNMQQINLWVNVPVFNEINFTDGINGGGLHKVMKYPLGMLGTGINLSEFSNFIVNASRDFDQNITPYTFNKYAEITSAADYEVVYNKTRLDDYIEGTGAEILETARKISSDSGLREIRFIYGGKMILVSSIPDMEWFLAVSYPLPGLLAINQSMNSVFFTMLFLIMFILIIINIYIARSETALEKQNAQLIEANQKTEIASRAKSDFLAAMSHELRTPLNTIIGFSEIELNKPGKSEDARISRDNITRIHQSGLHLLGIINEILDLSKLDSGKFELVPDEYDTAMMIKSTVDMNLIRIGSKYIQFALEIEDNFPAKLTGDELRIKQIMNNLLSNAIKFTREGTVKLSISSSEIEPDRVLVTIAVSDTGIGIKAEDMGKLFDDYTQLDTRTNKEVEGTGLGLSISKKIAQMMSGDITVESEYGKGSCFMAKIFQDKAENQSDGNSVIGKETAAALRNCLQIADNADYGNMRVSGKTGADKNEKTENPLFTILAVDDHLNNLLLIREQLKPYGIQVDTASSGQEAVEKIKGIDSPKAPYDLILMDHMMPGMDGIETMKEIRKDGRYANIPVIVLTANALRGMREYYLEQGFTDFIAKPVDQMALNDVIRKRLTGNGEIEDGIINAVFSGEIIRQRVDMLNHIGAAFEMSGEIDGEYYRRLSDLIESLCAMPVPQALLYLCGRLKDAAGRKEAELIPDLIRSLCEEFDLWAKNDGNEDRDAAGIVKRLKAAIIDGDSDAAGMTVKELGTAALTPAEREMYFGIYDALMDDDNEKALERIKEWLE